MRKLYRLFSMLLAFCLVWLAGVPAQAAETEDYTYTVRFLAGSQGTIGGGEAIVHTGLKYGDRVTFSQRDVSLHNGSKYYVKGIRESGKDNSTAFPNGSFLVTGDQDYVVAYGILGNAVRYRVYYRDKNGKDLAPFEEYYGNVGDRPVVAYLHIDGYRPQAYNITRTLSENADENVFTFIYSRSSTGNGGGSSSGGSGGSSGSGDGGSGTVPAPAPAPGTAPTAPPAGADAGGAGAAPAAGAADAGEGGQAGEDMTAGEAQEETEPVELLDEDVPLADGGLGSPFEDVTGDMAQTFNKSLIIGVLAAVVVLLAGGWVLWPIYKRKKKKE